MKIKSLIVIQFKILELLLTCFVAHHSKESYPNVLQVEKESDKVILRRLFDKLPSIGLLSLECNLLAVNLPCYIVDYIVCVYWIAKSLINSS